MGLFAKLRGTERSAAAEAAVERLAAVLPAGWQLTELRQQMFCRRPVKLYAWGASASGPAGERVLTLSADEDGVGAVGAAADRPPPGRP